MRHIVFDTETTGFTPASGHRLIEIAAIELIDMEKTGEKFHVYVNPEMKVPEDAVKVHGITTEFLADKPKFAEIHRQFVDFVGDAALVAHNISFDMSFINFELGKLQIAPLTNQRIDTMALAKRRFPGAKANLDNVCRLLGIDLSSRTKHGAMIDTELLVDVFLQLSPDARPRQDLAGQLAQAPKTTNPNSSFLLIRKPPEIVPARTVGAPDEEEEAKHSQMFGFMR